MISTDRLIFDEKSAVRLRQIEYAKGWEEVHIVVFGSKFQFPNSNFQTLSSNCFAYSTRSTSKFLYPFDAIKIGRQIITEHQITDISCQDSSLTAMAGVSLKKSFNIPLEIQIHEDLGSPHYAHNITNKIRRILARKYLPQADHVRVVSERIKKYLVDDLKIEQLDNGTIAQRNNSKIEVRPIAVDTEWIKNAPVLVDLHRKYRQFDKIVLMASRLEKEKNIELAIKAWSKVISAVPGAGLIIVGNGSLRSKLKTQSAKLLPSSSKLQASSLNPNSPIIFEDWVDKPILVSYYKTADLFLNTSLFEGYGMTLVEAQAAGCPIISTDVGIAMEVGATIVEFNAHDVAEKIIHSL